MPKLLLLDGHSLAYRAFFALPPDMQTKTGTYTNAVYGFTSMLVKMLADEKPEHLVVAFDTPKPTFRDEMDKTYKAGRATTPDLFIAQLPLIHEVLKVLDIPILEVDGFEADDVIATLATQGAAQNIDVIIVTGDRDSYQLVEDPHIKVLYNKRGVSDYAMYDETGIFEKTGVTPKQYSNYAALRGDKSDNLPGVPGIGEKTASKLIATYGNLEGIYEHLEELPPKQKTNLAEWKEQVFHNRAMSELRRDVELSVGPGDLTLGNFDTEAARTLFNQLEFRSLYDRLREAMGHTVSTAEKEPVLEIDVQTVHDASVAAKFLTGLTEAGTRYVIEPGWVSLAGRSPLLGLAFANSYQDATYIPNDLLQDTNVQQILKELLTHGGPPLVTHHAKELMLGLAKAVIPAKAGIAVQTLDLDTAVLAYLVDPSERLQDLTEVASRYTGMEIVSPDQVEGTLDFAGDAAGQESGRRAVAVMQLIEPLEEAVAARDLTKLYEEIERPLVRVLAEMEATGIEIDQPFLNELHNDLTARCGEFEKKIQTLAGEPFNINSTQQLRVILFEKLHLTPVKKTKTGASTDADSLQKLVGEHPIIEELLKYREVEKLRSTYVDALPPLIGKDGRIHATFNQTATTTGRISSENPNMQNIPVRTSEGLEIRKIFIAKDNCGLLTADYSQIELRILAHLSDDPGLIEAFERDEDIHTVTAARVFGIPEKNVDTNHRRVAKMVNYGLAYGMEAYGLGQRLGIPPGEAKEILDAYFNSFPNVHQFMEDTVTRAHQDGFTTTMFGRRRTIPELMSNNFRIRQMGERMAKNAPTQGSAADVFKLAMLAVDRVLTQEKFASRMILTVHDELVFEVPEKERELVEPAIRKAMEGVCELKVPLKADTGFGRNWAEAAH